MTRTQNVFMRHTQISVGILVVIFLIDRLLKYWTVSQLTSKSIIIIPGIFHFVYVPNPNLLYVLNLPVWVMSIIIIGVMSVLISIAWNYWQQYKIIEVLGMSSMILGGFSNILDRWFYGAVVDMIQIPFWSTFNIADVMIVIGAIIVASVSWGKPIVAEK